MKHMKHMAGCVAVAVVALILAFGFGDQRPVWVPYLLVLCCPVMMLFMVLAMRGDRDHHRDTSTPEHTPQS